MARNSIAPFTLIYTSTRWSGGGAINRRELHPNGPRGHSKTTWTRFWTFTGVTVTSGLILVKNFSIHSQNVLDIKVGVGTTISKVIKLVEV